MIKLISRKIACYLCSNERDNENYELYEYAGYIVLNAIIHIGTTIMLGFVFNMIIESLIFYMSFVFIRKFAGGFHAKTPIRCFIFSVSITVLVLLTIKMIICCNDRIVNYIMIVIGLLCMLAIFLLSPLDTDNKTLSQKEKHVYKIISIIIASALMVVALIFILFGNFNVSIPIIFGIVTSSLVLIMRKLQILLNKQPS